MSDENGLHRNQSGKSILNLLTRQQDFVLESICIQHTDMAQILIFIFDKIQKIVGKREKVTVTNTFSFYKVPDISELFINVK